MNTAPKTAGRLGGKKWRQHKDYYLKQCFRNSSEIETHKSWRQVAVWVRAHYCAELISFLQNPDAWIEGGVMMKDDGLTTVVYAKFGGGGGGG